MKLYTKEILIKELQKIAQRGWIENARTGHNHGTKFRLQRPNLPYNCSYPRFRFQAF